jgi:hypothetical protein
MSTSSMEEPNASQMWRRLRSRVVRELPLQPVSEEVLVKDMKASGRRKAPVTTTLNTSL